METCDQSLFLQEPRHVASSKVENEAKYIYFSLYICI